MSTIKQRKADRKEFILANLHLTDDVIYQKLLEMELFSKKTQKTDAVMCVGIVRNRYRAKERGSLI